MLFFVVKSTSGESKLDEYKATSMNVIIANNSMGPNSFTIFITVTSNGIYNATRF